MSVIPQVEPKPLKSCDDAACRLPLYGLVNFCPFCGTKQVLETAKLETVKPVVTAAKESVLLPERLRKPLKTEPDPEKPDYVLNPQLLNSKKPLQDAVIEDKLDVKAEDVVPAQKSTETVVSKNKPPVNTLSAVLIVLGCAFGLYYVITTFIGPGNKLKKLESLCAKAQEENRNKNFDQALNFVKEMQALDGRNPCAADAKSKAELGKKKIENDERIERERKEKAEALQAKKALDDADILAKQSIEIERLKKAAVEAAASTNKPSTQNFEIQKKQQIDEHIQAMKSAFEKKQWSVVRDRASQILKLEPGNREATSYLDETKRINAAAMSNF